ncbi:MAG TPA: hypothetical protein VGD67_28080 [Pseudonocardiaceae bacterium]
MTGFRSDNEVLAARAEAFAGLSERAGRIAADLTDALAAAGDCWGGDAAGQAFAASHVAPADNALGAVGALPEGLGDVRDRLSATAATYADSDQAGATTVRTAGRDLDEG